MENHRKGLKERHPRVFVKVEDLHQQFMQKSRQMLLQILASPPGLEVEEPRPSIAKRGWINYSRRQWDLLLVHRTLTPPPIDQSQVSEPGGRLTTDSMMNKKIVIILSVNKCPHCLTG